MTPNSKSPQSARAEKRLSQLIQLKRLERPDAEFWEEFEQEFRTRQLTTFVRIQPLHTRVRKACMILARKAAPPVAAVGAVALTFFAVSNTSYLLSSKDEDASTATTNPEIADVPEAVDSFFVVQTEDESAPETQESGIQPGMVYQVNLLQSSGTSPEYQLNATPVTFRHGKVEQPFGAKVISTQPSR